MNRMTNQEAIAAKQLDEAAEKVFERMPGQTERLILSRVAFRGELLRMTCPGSGTHDEVPDAMRVMKEHGAASILFDQDAYDRADAEELTR